MWDIEELMFLVNQNIDLMTGNLLITRWFEAIY